MTVLAVLVSACTMMVASAQQPGEGELPGQVATPLIIDRDGFVEISWSAPEAGGANLTGYILYRGEAEDDIPPLYVVGPDVTFIRDIYVVNGVTYYYGIQALNPTGVGPISPIVNATPYAAPEAPRDLMVEQEDGKVVLSWTAPNGTVARAAVTGYTVFRGKNSDMLDPITELGLDELRYIDEDVKEDATYYYAVGTNSEIGSGNITELVKVTIEGPEGTVFAVLVVSSVGMLLLAVLFVAWRVHGVDVGKDGT